MTYIISYLAALIPLLVLDGVWILVVAKGFYAKHMGFLFQQNMKLAPAGFFYPLYALAVLLLAVLPALENHSWQEALWKGALLGLAAYGAYDLTNHATIANWPLVMTITDMLWGMFVSAATSICAYFLIAYFR